MIRIFKQNAFSLIEVLTVMTIIAILAALLFPVFSSSKSRAEREVCASNLHQIGIATNLYLQDYDEVYPHAVTLWDRNHPALLVCSPQNLKDVSSIPIINVVLRPYLHSDIIFKCPSDDGITNRIGPPILPSMFAYGGDGSSYEFETLLDNQSSTCFLHPSLDEYAMDSDGTWHTYSTADFFHQAENMLFIDNHIKFIYPSIDYYNIAVLDCSAGASNE